MKEIKETPTLRCAIYTRKSNDEGLDMDFNTLDAQREAGENYIRSQSREGWVINPEHYDDGGYTGGNMERPALKKLIKDIKKGAVDVVVVYKIDRLSRSLTDFAKLVEVFDEYNVSFVSVTQHFNTKDSMGRLTLNILFSFAQFEREVIGERIRDKIAASKQKGMFMGGALPLGYGVNDRQLYIIPEEAELVQHIFKRYTQIKSVMQIVKELNNAGHRTKSYTSGTNRRWGGKEFNRQYVYRILHNPIYVGKISHKGKIHDGQHEGIISQKLWNKVHSTLKAENRHIKRTKSIQEFFLKGLIRCGCCNSMLTPYRHTKRNRVYRYYTSTRAIHKGHDTCEIRNISAGEIEPIVLSQVRHIIETSELGICVWDFDRFWDCLPTQERHRMAEVLIKGIVIKPDGITIDIKHDKFTILAKEIAKGKAQNDNINH